MLHLNETATRMETQKKKLDVIWISHLDEKDLIKPLLQNFAVYNRSAADILRMPYLKNITNEAAIRNAIDEIAVADINEAEFKRLVLDHIPNIPNDIKLLPVDSNLKKVSSSFVVQPVERNILFREY